MKILIVTNLFPPHFIGGYEVRCAEVARALAAAGHNVFVLTSIYGTKPGNRDRNESITEEIPNVRVCRSLNEYMWGSLPSRRPWTVYQAVRELSDARRFMEILQEFGPDVVNWWSMYGLSKLLLPLPLAWGIPDVHWIEHWWMIREYGPRGEFASAFWAKLWDGEWGPRGLRPLLRRAGREWERRTARKGIPTREFTNSPRHVCFVSEYMRALHREAGFEFPSSEIIYGGVPRAVFYEPVSTRRRDHEKLKLLYAGQVTEDRGLHTLIEAFGHLVPPVRSQLSLSVAGGNGPPEYLQRIKTKIEQLGLVDCVIFHGKVAHDAMPQMYKDHEILVFPSIRDEGLPLTMVEAMLSGCAVITTGSGGAMEIATQAALPLFPKDDPGALSQLLVRLVGDRSLVREIADHGQRVALDNFTSDRMMEQIQAMLLRITDEQGRTRETGRAKGLALQVQV
jgi:glycogen(starch) synthase